MSAYRNEDGTWVIIRDDGKIIMDRIPDEQSAWEIMDSMEDAE